MNAIIKSVIKLSREMQDTAWEFPFEDFDMTPITSEEIDSLGDEEIDVWEKWYDRFYGGDVELKMVCFKPDSNSLILIMVMNDSVCPCCMGTSNKFILTPKTNF